MRKLGRGFHQDATEYSFYPVGLHQPCRKIPVNSSRLDTTLGSGDMGLNILIKKSDKRPQVFGNVVNPALSQHLIIGTTAARPEENRTPIVTRMKLIVSS